MIELACIADGGFLRHTAAMLHSALERSQPAEFRIHLLHAQPIAEEDRVRLRKVVSPFGAELHLWQIDTARAADFPDGYFPRSVWFRILLPELLPLADQVLYLDSDIIVADDLLPLWETDLGGHLLGAVINPFYPFMPEYPRQTLGIARPQDYFNSGVLLMNLKRMRDEGWVARMREYARAHPGNSYPDQDALNVVCAGQWLALHPRWNVQSTYFELAPRELPVAPELVKEARERPAVIHYIGPFKPWLYLCRHPLQQLYFQHARATPWGAPRVEGFSLRNMILKRLPMAWIDRWMAGERYAARRWNGLKQRLSG